VAPSCEKLYVDTLTNREYSQETVEEASQAAFQRLTLVCSPPLQEYHLKLHCLVVAAVGEQNLSSLPDRLLPGTVDFHQAYLSPSIPQPSQAAVSSHQGFFSRGVRSLGLGVLWARQQGRGWRPRKLLAHNLSQRAQGPRHYF
jgi:hypothetical protein